MDNTIKKGEKFSIPQGFKAKQIAKMISNKYNVSPSDFKQEGSYLVYEPKKKLPMSKPKDMSIEDYFHQVVLKQNPELAEKFKMYPQEVWRPIKNNGRYFDGTIDYSVFYEVSNMGRIKMIDCRSASRSDITVGYDTPTRNAMQFTLNDRNGSRTTSDIKYMVADAFMEPKDQNLFEVIHIDGDYHNNKLENLAWAERKN